jgi:hypothetical protein
VTSDVYGYFGAKERKAEAELMEGVFGDHAELAELRLQPVDLGPQPLELAVVLVALAGRERWADQAELNEAP